MWTYHIMQHPDGTTKSVSDGPSFFAAMLAGIWAPVNKLWLHTAIIWGSGIVMTTYLVAAEVYITNPDMYNYILITHSMIIAVIYGMFGHKFIKKNLINNGFEEKMTVKAKTKGAALAQFLKSTTT